METLEKNKTEISGILKGFCANKHGDIDALELLNGQENRKINFPPHTAKTIMAAIKPGEFLTLTYKEEKPKHDTRGDKKTKLKLQFLTKASNNTISVRDIHPGKPDADQLPEGLNFGNFELIKGKRGELTGIRSGKQLVHIHKKDQELADKINTDSKLQISAVKRMDDGFINKNRDEVYHIRTVTLNGQIYNTKN